MPFFGRDAILRFFFVFWPGGHFKKRDFNNLDKSLKDYLCQMNFK